MGGEGGIGGEGGMGGEAPATGGTSGSGGSSGAGAGGTAGASAGSGGTAGASAGAGGTAGAAAGGGGIGGIGGIGGVAGIAGIGGIGGIGGIAGTSSGPPNLISDPGFESGTKGSWFTFNNSPLAVSTTVFHAGTYALGATAMPAYGAIALDIKSLVSLGSTYTASVWAQPQNSTSQTVNLQYALTCNDGAGGTSSAGTTHYKNAQYGAPVTNGNWGHLSGPVEFSECASTSISSVVLFIGGATNGDIYIDDVSLTLAQ
jgi:hypothetical protein